MKELAVAQKQARDEEGNIHIYDYSILVGEMTVSQGFACESYGVRVRERGGESGEVPDITVSISRIDELMELLVRNTVSPCTLRDVVDDWL
ncbi:MAG: DUF6514 family protein [Oscillospiraceae bacterium]